MDMPPGSSEFLSSLLTGPHHSCPHENKEKDGDLPLRLGFFRAADGTMTYIDTDKLCQQCYELAVPEGFNVWSTYYKFSEYPLPEELKERFGAGMLDSDEWSRNYGSNATATGSERHAPPKGWAALRPVFDDDYYPWMSQAGTEDDPDAEVRRERMPSNAEAHEAFRYLQFLGKPFYIDQLHLTRKWDANAEDIAAENRRVARENYLAYKGAANGLVGTGVGGAGLYSTVEQRILGNRAIEIPGSFGREDDDDTTLQQLNESYARQGLPPGTEVMEVPANYPEGYRMPLSEAIDAEEHDMTGQITGPTLEEIKRRNSLELEFDRFKRRGSPPQSSTTGSPARSSSTNSDNIELLSSDIPTRDINTGGRSQATSASGDSASDDPCSYSGSPGSPGSPPATSHVPRHAVGDARDTGVNEDNEDEGSFCGSDYCCGSDC